MRIRPPAVTTEPIQRIEPLNLPTRELKKVIAELKQCIAILSSKYRKSYCTNVGSCAFGLLTIANLFCLNTAASLASAESNIDITQLVCALASSLMLNKYSYLLYKNNIQRHAKLKRTHTLASEDYRKIEGMASRLGNVPSSDTLFDRLQYFEYIKKEFEKIIVERDREKKFDLKSLSAFSIEQNRRGMNSADITETVREYVMHPFLYKPST